MKTINSADTRPSDFVFKSREDVSTFITVIFVAQDIKAYGSVGEASDHLYNVLSTDENIAHWVVEELHDLELHAIYKINVNLQEIWQELNFATRFTLETLEACAHYWESCAHELLNHPNQILRLGLRKYPSCAEKLIYDPDFNVRYYALKTDEKFVPLLMNDPAPRVRAGCAEVGFEYAKLLVNDPHESVRRQCVEWESLALLLTNDRDLYIRIRCAKLWKSCAIQMINDTDIKVRQACVEYWLDCAQLLYQDTEPMVRQRCVVCWPDQFAMLLVNDSSPEVRSVCALKSFECARLLVNDPEEIVQKWVRFHLDKKNK